MARHDPRAICPSRHVHTMLLIGEKEVLGARADRVERDHPRRSLVLPGQLGVRLLMEGGLLLVSGVGGVVAAPLSCGYGVSVLLDVTGHGFAAVSWGLALPGKVRLLVRVLDCGLMDVTA